MHDAPRRPFIINCANLDTGEEFQSRIWALDQQEAASLIRRKGIAISTIFEEPLPVVVLDDASRCSLAPLQADVRSLHVDVLKLTRSKLAVSPIQTIGWGIVVSFFCWVFLLGIIFIVLSFLGIGVSLLSRH